MRKCERCHNASTVSSSDSGEAVRGQARICPAANKWKATLPQFSKSSFSTEVFTREATVKEDVFYIEFVNGLVKLTTDEISGPNHMKAEEMVTKIAQGMGGKVERSRRTDKQGVAHSHQHGEHTHEH
jgi:hypothetical protein